MDLSLIGNFIRFPTAKQVWDFIATTFFDLRRCLWREIDFRRPNPMKCAVDIQTYNSILQKERVYIFLDGLDDQLDNIRSDQAYAHVQREDIRQTVMTSGADTALGAVIASKGIKASKSYTLTKTGSPALSSGKSNPPHKTQIQPDGGKCTHCGNTRHTRETCFKLHGYLDWWNEFQTRKKREGAGSNEGIGRAAMVNVEPHLSLISKAESPNNSMPLNDQGNYGQVLLSFNHRDDRVWIIDSGATDHMTFDPNDFSQTTPPRRNRIGNANGVTYPVIGDGTDILTKEIIGRGTKKGGGGGGGGGLYYMDDFSPGRANHIVFGVFQSFHVMVQTQFSAKVETLRTDNGGEYVNQQFQAYFQSHGLLHETSRFQTPQ
ncbi:hypothetical protein ACOSQ3_017217 [Xanthoceras sorbifolium]